MLFSYLVSIRPQLVPFQSFIFPDFDLGMIVGVVFFFLMQLCDLLKSRVECPEFLEKLELDCAQLPGSQNITGKC